MTSHDQVDTINPTCLIMRDIPVSFSVVGKVDLPVYQLKVHTAIHIYARFMAYENIKGRKIMKNDNYLT